MGDINYRAFTSWAASYLQIDFEEMTAMGYHLQKARGTYPEVGMGTMTDLNAKLV